VNNQSFAAVLINSMSDGEKAQLLQT